MFLRDRGLRPRRSFGQNFMVDTNLLEFLVRSARVERGDKILEVGTGTGLLTQKLLDRGAEVVTVEADPGLFEAVSPLLRPREAVRALCGDVLEGKHRLRDEVERIVVAWRDGEYKVVSNLPYNAAVPVVVNLLRSNARPERLVVTLQKEVADRFMARSGTRAYGRISVEVQLRGALRRLRDLPPDVFWPRPRVKSTVLELIPFPEGMRPRPKEEAGFSSFLDAVFSRRRKKLSAAPGHARQDIERVLVDLGQDPGIRGECLEPEVLVRIHDALFSSE